MTLLAPALVGVTLAMVVTSADADFIITAGAPSSTTNWQFTGQPDAFTLNGRLNQGIQLPQLTSLQPIVNQGSSKILPQTANTLTNLTITIPLPPPGYFFNTISFEAEKPVIPTGGFVTATAVNQDGVTVSAEADELDQSYTVTFTSPQLANGQTMRSLTLDFSVPLADINNPRFGTLGEGGPFEQVPGPIVGAGLPGLIAALGGLIAMARRRRKQLA